MTSVGQEQRLHGVSKKPGEPLAEYRVRAREEHDARRARFMFFDEHVDEKLIAVRLSRSEEWVREVVSFRRLAAVGGL